MYKKRLIFIFTFLLFMQIVLAQNTPGNRKELYDLLKDRKEKFDSYSNSLEKRSGIFGNKTKNDIRRSNEVLIEIVKSDNKIISALNRIADFKDFEKVNLTYDVSAQSNQLNNLLQATDTLAKQVDSLKEINKQLENKNNRVTSLLYVILILVSMFVIAWIILIIVKRLKV